jgi:hypothetical protein
MPPPYDPVGQCIYCGATRYSDTEPDHKLGEEHIIPLAIRGQLVLPEASCQECEAITSGIETRCTALFDPGRYHLGIRGRKWKKEKTRFPLRIGLGAHGVKVSKSDHPGVLWGFQYGLPGALLGLPSRPEDKFGGDIRMAPAVPDMKARLRRIGSMHVRIGAGVPQDLFGRMLAKIGHSFSVAERGLDGFAPLLLNAIRGEQPYSLAWLIGSPLGNDESPEGTEHEIRFVSVAPEYLTVRIRLFAKHNMPAYYVVAGRLQ